MRLPPGPWGRSKPPVGVRVNWSHPLTRDLVGCWLFHEGAGTKNVDAAYMTDLTMNAGCSFGAAGMAIGLKTDGSTGESTASPNVYLDRPLNVNQLTIAMWIANGNTAQTNRYLMSYGGAGNSYPIIYGFTTRTYETFWNAGGIRNTIKQINAGDTDEHLIVAAFDGTRDSMRCYFDGQETLNTTQTGNLPAAGGAAGLRISSVAASYFSGVHSQLMIWARQLSVEEAVNLPANRYAILAPLRLTESVNSVAATGVVFRRTLNPRTGSRTVPWSS